MQLQQEQQQQQRSRQQQQKPSRRSALAAALGVYPPNLMAARYPVRRPMAAAFNARGEARGKCGASAGARVPGWGVWDGVPALRARQAAEADAAAAALWIETLRDFEGIVDRAAAMKYRAVLHEYEGAARARDTADTHSYRRLVQQYDAADAAACSALYRSLVDEYETAGLWSRVYRCIEQQYVDACAEAPAQALLPPSAHASYGGGLAQSNGSHSEAGAPTNGVYTGGTHGLPLPAGGLHADAVARGGAPASGTWPAYGDSAVPLHVPSPGAAAHANSAALAGAGAASGQADGHAAGTVPVPTAWQGRAFGDGAAAGMSASGADAPADAALLRSSARGGGSLTAAPAEQRRAVRKVPVHRALLAAASSSGRRGSGARDGGAQAPTWEVGRSTDGAGDVAAEVPAWVAAMSAPAHEAEGAPAWLAVAPAPSAATLPQLERPRGDDAPTDTAMADATAAATPVAGRSSGSEVGSDKELGTLVTSAVGRIDGATDKPLGAAATAAGRWHGDFAYSEDEPAAAVGRIDGAAEEPSAAAASAAGHGDVDGERSSTEAPSVSPFRGATRSAED
eukprot:230427-Chlamydomonas_euryale.AAC.1